MRKMLVTGGAGFIGGNFVHHWQAAFPDDLVVVLDALTYAGNLSTLEQAPRTGNFIFRHGDIADAPLVRQLMSEHAIDTIVHFAAESHVDRSIVDPGAFVQTNVVGTRVLLDEARNAWYQNGAWVPGVRFHHVSTDEVYGSLQPHDPPFTETSSYSPNSPYAASKAAADHLVRSYVHTYGLPATISNCSNNYGPYHFPEKLIPLVIVNALHGRPLPIYGDGKQVRDWLFVEDHCRAIARILEAPVAGRTFNIGGKAEHENIEIVHRICRLLDDAFSADAELHARFPDCPASMTRSCSELLTFVKDRPGHDRRYAIDPSRIEAELSFKPSQTLESGLAQTVRWYLDNESWWRAVMDGSYRKWINRQYAS